MPERLPGDDRSVEIEGVRITSPGLAGIVDVHRGGSSGMRSAEAATEDLSDALNASGMVEQLTVEIREHEERPLPTGAATRSTTTGEPAVEIEVPTPGSGRMQVLLAADEDGVLTWHLPDDVPPSEAATRGGDTRTYLLPRHVVTPPETPGHRGLIGALGKKLFKVLSFRLIDPLIGEVADFYARRWENEHKPHRLRSFTPDDFTDDQGTPIDGDRLDSLAADRCLLFVHGTLSSTHGAFHRLPRKVVEELHRHYEGRVFAFDHPTVSVDPAVNARFFLETLGDRALDCDVVCHSRGGLVTRVLAERPAVVELPASNLEMGKVVFVATPNAGTPLADRNHLSDFIDTYTNILSLVPDNVVTDALEVLITVLKQLAVGALGGLEGIMAQAPDSKFLRQLNQAGGAGDTRYAAISSDFEPAAGSSLARFARDVVTDRVFGDAGNDLVVPTDGVHVGGGGGRFPITDPLLFASADAIDHSGFWPEERTGEALAQWLTA